TGPTGFTGTTGPTGFTGTTGPTGLSGVAAQMLFFNTGTNIANNNYLAYNGQNSNINFEEIVVTRTGTFQNLFAHIYNVGVTGSGGSRTFTVTKNGTNTALFVTIPQ